MSDARSSPCPTLIFDPFFIGNDHVEHYSSADIIKIEKIGKVFCPQCLSKASTLDRIMDAEDKLYDKYIVSLFVVLDQNSQKSQLRKIIVPMLDILLRKRSIKELNDFELYDLLRIIYKVLKAEAFSINEFSSIARIYSTISREFFISNPLPLKSLWRITKFMLDYSLEQLSSFSYDLLEALPEEEAGFCASLPMIIQTYLNILKRFTVEEISETMFTLHEDEASESHQKHYKETQVLCHKFVSNKLLPIFYPYLTLNARLLSPPELNMVHEYYVAMRECLLSAFRINDQDYISFVQEKDFLSISHSLIYKYHNHGLRMNIRKFVKHYVLHFIFDEFGEDDVMLEISSLDDIAETNHKNAMEYRKDKTKYKRTIFYFLANVAAIRQKPSESAYFNAARVRKLYRITDPVALNMTQSIVIMKAYASLLPRVFEDSKDDDCLKYVKRLWDSMQIGRRFDEFHEIFCSKVEVFEWASRYCEFTKLVDSTTVEFILSKGQADGKSDKVLENLLDHESYKENLQNFLNNHKTAAPIISKIALNSFCESETIDPLSLYAHKNLIENFSRLLSTLFYGNILDHLYNDARGAIEKSARVIDIVNLLLYICPHFHFEVVDGRFVSDLFKVIESLYRIQHMEEDDYELILPFNEFLRLLIVKRHHNLMEILKYLNFHVLGYMNECIADYTDGDILAESIARLFVAYDNIDYPLDHHIERSLYSMDMSIVNWMLSSNPDLHALALKLAPKMLTNESKQSNKAYLTTGLIQMLLLNPGLIAQEPQTVGSILKYDEVLYNPLLTQVIHVLLDEHKLKIEDSLGQWRLNCPSPALSFTSSNSSTFNEDRLEVDRILSCLQDGDKTDEGCRMSSSVFVSKSVEDQDSNRPWNQADLEVSVGEPDGLGEEENECIEV